MPTLSKDHLPGYHSHSGGLLGVVLGTVSPGRLENLLQNLGCSGHFLNQIEEPFSANENRQEYPTMWLIKAELLPHRHP